MARVTKDYVWLGGGKFTYNKENERLFMYQKERLWFAERRGHVRSMARRRGGHVWLRGDEVMYVVWLGGEEVIYG
jgi:hypothetical protein